MDYAAMGHPEVGFFMMLVIGAIAGYIAEKATNSDHGLITNVLVGIAGAFVGGKIAEILEIPLTGGFFRTLIIATLGAILVLYLWRMVRGRRDA
jgi:uncharacterized membrane protein YeaQ/YmgE (transglycosylase-associated protein family)